MKERAEELRAEGKQGVKKADGLQAVLDKIAEMAPADRALAERVHVAVTAAAPELAPKTWYGMPALCERRRQDRRVLPGLGQVQLPVLDPRLPRRGQLDDGGLWPVSYALAQWSPVVEKKVIALVKAAIS